MTPSTLVSQEVQVGSSQRSEQEYVKLAVAGDEHAFTFLYEKYIDNIYRFVLYRVADSETAEDLTSAVFLKVWEKLGSYQDRGLPFRAWLFRIARNAVIDHYRTRKEVAPIDLISPEELPKTSALADDVEKSLEAERIRRLMDQLTDIQREVLILKLINGFSTEEIAETLGKKAGAVRALQMRALNALSKLIEEDSAQA
jgi:RNA polymerase sigma-70 factor (ECF subfamily)